MQEKEGIRKEHKRTKAISKKCKIHIIGIAEGEETKKYL